MEKASNIFTHWHAPFSKYYYADGTEERSKLMTLLSTATSDKDIPAKYKKHPTLYTERVEAKKEKERVEKDVSKLNK